MECRNFAHRGFSGQYPENTMTAFEKALEAGCEGIEMDVHLTKDNKIVIIHDEKTDRTSNIKGYVKDMTYEELKKADFSYIYSDKAGLCRIPTLREYFDLVKDKDIITNIELKTGIFEYPGIEKAVYDMIKKYKLEEKILISSFNHNSVMRMKAIAPELKYGFLSETWILNTGEYLNRYDIEAYHPDFHMLTDTEVHDLRAHNIKINTWTVNEPDDIQHMIDIRTEGIISNYPDRVKKLLEDNGLR